LSGRSRRERGKASGARSARGCALSVDVGPGPAFRRAASACTGGPHGEHQLWTVVGSPRLTHPNASIQVFAEGEGGSRVVWVADLRPHGVADTIRGMIEQGMALMKKTLEK